MENLVQLRQRNEARRFERLREQDTPRSFTEEAARDLERELVQRIRGEARFDEGIRAAYATDGSNYRQVPIGVVVPRDIEDVVATVASARKFGAPLLSRGGGTSLAGQCCNVALVMDFSRHLRDVLEIDPVNRLARVQPGCVLDRLREQARAAHDLTFGPDPATHSHCTLGGMLGNNSCGIHSLLAVNNGLGQRTSDNTHALEILTYAGERMRVGATTPEELERIIRSGSPQGRIYARLRAIRDRYGDEIRARFPKLPRRVSGYNLDELLPENQFHVARALVGSEATCVTILEATLHLVPEPKARSLLVLGYPDIFSAGDHVPEILEHRPIGLEGIDDLLFHFTERQPKSARNLQLLPPGMGWLLVEFGGDSREDSDAQAHALMQRLEGVAAPPSMKLFDDPGETARLWKVREGGLAATAWVPGLPDGWPGWEDSAVPPPRVGAYLRELKALIERYEYQVSLYGHLGQGCVHCRIPFDMYTAEGVRKYRSFIDEASDLVLKYGGSLSGEHGDGQSRAELLPKMFGPRIMEAFREFKRAWDPENRMNPGKIVDAARILDDLRLGPDYSPPAPETHFHFGGDDGFARAALRCVGVGECRREAGGTMCPSYMVTHEELHSTRGRSRLLFEMLNGEVVTDGWRSEAVKEALDLCLACKGCKDECPVKVDMATYKAEFLSHYHAGRLRPRQAYAFGLIHTWSRLASKIPLLVNLVTHLPGTSRLAKWLAGMSREREVPRFAPETFRSWFARRPKGSEVAPRVLLWTDTFNDHFHPETAKAAVRVLEAAGYRVLIPRRDLCCGRPLYDYGFLDTAKRRLREIIDALRPEIQADLPIVVLEPSCAAVFRDELLSLFPHDEDAKRLHAQTFVLGELLDRGAPKFTPPRLARKALVQAHCHHKAVLGFESDRRILEKMGLEVEIPDSGCCGMAGAFGFERGRSHEVSIACGERVLIPRVRAAAEDTVIVADGFSCREQIAQMSDRTALHLAELLDLALRKGPRGPVGERPEAELLRARRVAEVRATQRAGLALGAAGAVGALLYFWWRRR